MEAEILHAVKNKDEWLFANTFLEASRFYILFHLVI